MNAAPVLVVGGGLGGLLLAMRLSQRGVPVRVFEKNAAFGGYNGRTADGVPLVCYKALGLEPEGGLYRRLVEHDVWRGPPPKRMDVCDHLLSAGESLALPGSVDALRDWLVDRYPAERRGVDALLDTVRRCHDAIGVVSSVTSTGSRAQAHALLGQLARERYRDRLCADFADPELRRLLSLRAFSAANTTLTMAAYLARILIDGLYSVPGSGAALADMIVDHLRRRPGVELHAGAEVTEMLFDADSRAVGVRTADGGVHRGEVVINIDPLRLAGLPGTPPPVAASIVRGGADSPASLGALCAVFDVEPDLGRALSSAYAGTARIVQCDPVDPFDVLDAREAGALDLRMLKINFDGPADGAVERVYVEMDCAGAASAQATAGGTAAPWVARVRDRLAQLQPDFADGIAATRVFTPADFAGLTGNRLGAASGFADSSQRPRRLDQTLQDHGMTLVGQWSQFGSGLPQLDMSAVQAYRTLRSRALAPAG